MLLFRIDFPLLFFKMNNRMLSEKRDILSNFNAYFIDKCICIVCLMYKYTPNTVSAGLREVQYLKTLSLNNHVANHWTYTLF